MTGTKNDTVRIQSNAEQNLRVMVEYILREVIKKDKTNKDEVNQSTSFELNSIRPNTDSSK